MYCRRVGTPPRKVDFNKGEHVARTYYHAFVALFCARERSQPSSTALTSEHISERMLLVSSQ